MLKCSIHFSLINLVNPRQSTPHFTWVATNWTTTKFSLIWLAASKEQNLSNVVRNTIAKFICDTIMKASYFYNGVWSGAVDMT